MQQLLTIDTLKQTYKLLSMPPHFCISSVLAQKFMNDIHIQQYFFVMVPNACLISRPNFQTKQQVLDIYICMNN